MRQRALIPQRLEEMQGDAEECFTYADKLWCVCMRLRPLHPLLLPSLALPISSAHCCPSSDVSVQLSSHSDSHTISRPRSAHANDQAWQAGNLRRSGEAVMARARVSFQQAQARLLFLTSTPVQRMAQELSIDALFAHRTRADAEAAIQNAMREMQVLTKMAGHVAGAGMEEVAKRMGDAAGEMAKQLKEMEAATREGTTSGGDAHGLQTPCSVRCVASLCASVTRR